MNIIPDDFDIRVREEKVADRESTFHVVMSWTSRDGYVVEHKLTHSDNANRAAALAAMAKKEFADVVEGWGGL